MRRGRWRTKGPVDLGRMLDLSTPLYPGELAEPIRRDTAEDEANAADLDEIEAEEASPNPWAAELERLAALPTVVVSVSALGRSIDMTVTGPLHITRQVVELALANLEVL